MHLSYRSQFALLLFLLLACGQMFSQNEQDYSYSDIGREKFNDGDYRAAYLLAQKAIDTDSTNAWAYMLKYDVELKFNQIEEAIETIELCQEIFPEFSTAYDRHGSLYLSMNEPEKALAKYDRAIELAESEEAKLVYLINRASCRGIFMDYRGAIHDLENVLSRKPDEVGLLNNLAIFYTNVGETQKAVSTLKKIIKLDPENASWYVNLGWFYSEIDSLPQSQKYFDLAAKMSPDDPYLLSNRGFLFYKMKKYARAMQDLNRSAELYPENSYVYRSRALVHLALEEHEAACENLQLSKELDFYLRYGNEVNELLEEHCGEKE